MIEATQKATEFAAYEQSVVETEGVTLYLGKRGTEKRLCLAWERGAEPAGLSSFCGERFAAEGKYEGLCGRLDHTNAVALRKLLPWAGPRVIGLETSAGLGDRLGIATPAHVRAVRGTGLRPFFAQQSIREMQRTGRTPEEVMDTATWGVFQEGWQEGFGSDADHLKTPEDIDATAAAGFTMFTIDPGDHVDNAAQTDDIATLAAKFDALPWADLETSVADMQRRCFDHEITLPDGTVITFDRDTILRAAAKYGRALAHTARMYRHVKQVMGDRPFELEMSVDETATPTSVAEHAFVASELCRMGVKWVSLAPRFIGEFEKGVDYIGDLDAFRRSFAQHVAVAQHYGPYKISIHSGSDKFSIYPIAAELTGGLVHLKTAGTSYLEALRAISKIDPALFREIMAFAIERYPEDRASYHVSADLAKVPAPGNLPDDALPGILDQHDTRETLHVTFGSVLRAEVEGRPRFKDRFMAALEGNEEVHYQTVCAHIERHVRPFEVKRQK
jgi:hypothetical protein